MRQLRLPTMLAVCALLTAGLAACGGSSSGGSAAGSTPATGASSASGTATVTIKDFAFHPASLTVTPGTKVTFIQEDSIVHNADAKGANSFKTPSLNKGQKYTVTFTKPGTYNYICDFHPSQMHGTIVVS